MRRKRTKWMHKALLASLVVFGLWANKLPASKCVDLLEASAFLHQLIELAPSGPVAEKRLLDLYAKAIGLDDSTLLYLDEFPGSYKMYLTPTVVREIVGLGENRRIRKRKEYRSGKITCNHREALALLGLLISRLYVSSGVAATEITDWDLIPWILIGRFVTGQITDAPREIVPLHYGKLQFCVTQPDHQYVFRFAVVREGVILRQHIVSFRPRIQLIRRDGGTGPLSGRIGQ